MALERTFIISSKMISILKLIFGILSDVLIDKKTWKCDLFGYGTILDVDNYYKNSVL